MTPIVFCVITCTFARIAALNFISRPLMPKNTSPKTTTKNNTRDLVLMHIPFNFGHTIEKMGMFGHEKSRVEVGQYIESLGGFGDNIRKQNWSEVNQLVRQGGAIWGHFHPELQEVSPITGCPLYYTPPKYWPQDVAKRYFGDKTIFALVRDPYERLVAQFRGDIIGYGNDVEVYHQTCDVDKAVREKLIEHLMGGNKFGSGCTLIQQAEYFEGPYGVKLPIDVRDFPNSMNVVFDQHGYTDPSWHIDPEEILHVEGCDNVWPGNLTEETKSLVRAAFPQDFSLLCMYFGYCEQGENTCIHGVPNMCPEYICPSCVSKQG